MDQARILGVGAVAGAHSWGGVSPFKIHHSIAFKRQSITGRPPLEEILCPPLWMASPILRIIFHSLTLLINTGYYIFCLYMLVRSLVFFDL